MHMKTFKDLSPEEYDLHLASVELQFHRNIINQITDFVLKGQDLSAISSFSDKLSDLIRHFELPEKSE